LIEAQNLSVSFNGKPALEKIGFSLPEKNFLAIIGPNGAGKTTLGLLFAGVIPEFIKANVSGKFSVPANTALLMQNPSTQFFALTVKEEIGNTPQKAAGIEELWDKSVFELSEGEKQRVNLAANLCNGSATLILDEPLELLDPLQANRFLKTINAFRGRKTVLWLDKDACFVEGWKKIFLARTTQEFPEPGKTTPGKELLKADFSVKRNDFELGQISFTLREGEKTALLGLNGSGKTTLLKALAGIYRSKGSIGMKSGFSFSPQNPEHVFFEKNVKEEIGSAEKMRFFGLQGQARQFPERLSKGQKKMLSLASLREQELFLLDEPTTWLDAGNKARVYSWINSSKSAFLIATHDRKLLDYCDRVLLVEGGELKECSSTAVKRFFQAGR
jgi:energy-coupling factor transporter ATP-binding protein EcfA2